MTDETEEDSFADEALPADIAAPGAPSQLRFWPWHKPRKQMVRKVQWAELVGRLLTELKRKQQIRDDEPFRYMTLPGADLLDVRVLAETCTQKSRRMEFTGFCADGDDIGAQLRRNIDEFALRNSHVILPSSTVYGHKFEEISGANSQARMRVRERGIFHAINVDACGPLANGDPAQGQRIIDALKSLVEFQLSHAGHKWLLFVTTVAQPDSVNADSLAGLYDAIHENANANHDFGNAAIQAISPGAGSLTEALATSSASISVEFLRAYCLGLAKWLSHLCHQASWTVRMRRCCFYSTLGSATPNMPSLAFEFIPPNLNLIDNFGVTTNPPIDTNAQIKISDLHFAASVRKMWNVDERLSDDKELEEDLIQQTEGLLKQAGHQNVDDPATGYRPWLDG